MDNENKNNPFEWLPQFGQSIKIPGGVLWCDEWEVTSERQTMRAYGEIKFRFEMDIYSYEEAMREKPIHVIEQ
jgi:hypothetical protein